ncbi:hypothetical protein EYR41_004976 [Orbilia oligospora]|uniref:Uncharacterized protein n=1 Tax=Orbilia oligospora TaxID=2813651 RepID=A0A7C8PVM0_ORBOL|nr:hypothetical protein TWF751_009315 [Orbilia oligospora]TGJ68896.1 hypothetical protein EYR41_004976 [Orbilia oligospora]
MKRLSAICNRYHSLEFSQNLSRRFNSPKRKLEPSPFLLFWGLLRNCVSESNPLWILFFSLLPRLNAAWPAVDGSTGVWSEIFWGKEKKKSRRETAYDARPGNADEGHAIRVL